MVEHEHSDALQSLRGRWVTIVQSTNAGWFMRSALFPIRMFTRMWNLGKVWSIEKQLFDEISVRIVALEHALHEGQSTEARRYDEVIERIVAIETQMHEQPHLDELELIAFLEELETQFPDLVRSATTSVWADDRFYKLACMVYLYTRNKIDNTMKTWFHINLHNSTIPYQITETLEPGGRLVHISRETNEALLLRDDLIPILDWSRTTKAGSQIRLRIFVKLQLERVTTPSFDIFINATDPGPLPRYLKEYGMWEPEETEYFKQNIKPGAVVVDVGANIGYHTLLAAHLVGDTGRVIAIEPEPVNLAVLGRNVNLLPHPEIVKIHGVAAGEIAGAAPLYYASQNYGDHRMFAVVGNNQFAEDGVPRGYIFVMVNPLDEVLKDEPRIDFIKLDVQGYEISALRGMTQILKRHRPNILFEFWPYGLKKADHDPLELIEIVRSLEYKLLVLQQSLVPFEVSKLQSHIDEAKFDYYVNLIAVPN